MRKKKELPLFENVKVEAVAAEGKAIARIDDQVVFVPFVAPGDVVDLKVKKKKRSYMEAVAVNYHQMSERAACEPPFRHLRRV